MKDTIYRQDAIDIASGYCHPANIAKELMKLPSAEPERKTGKWLDAYYSFLDGCRVWHRICSVCGYERDDDNPDKDTNYCPHCGVRIVRGERDE